MIGTFNSRKKFFQNLWQGLSEADAIFHGNYERDEITMLRERIMVQEEKTETLIHHEPNKAIKEKTVA